MREKNPDFLVTIFLDSFSQNITFGENLNYSITYICIYTLPQKFNLR